jgi:uncharacterized membrane protein
MFEVKSEMEWRGTGTWAVLHQDGSIWERHATQEEAQEAADKYQKEEDAREYVRYVLFSQLVAPAGNDVLAGLSQNDVRELIREVADEGGY